MGSTRLAENHLLASLIRIWSNNHVPHRGRTDRSMSALGQKRTSEHVRVMSLYPQMRTFVERAGMSALCQKRTRCSAARRSRYSITSSAVVSSDCGRVSPSAFAVLRLMTRLAVRCPLASRYPGEMVQFAKGLRLHSAYRRWRGRVCPYLGRRARRPEFAQ